METEKLYSLYLGIYAFVRSEKMISVVPQYGESQPELFVIALATGDAKKELMLRHKEDVADLLYKNVK